MPHWFEVFLCFCGALITIAGAVYALPKMFVGFRRIYRGFIGFCVGVAKLDKAVPTLLRIGDEFSPNHGTSLKDQVTRIDTRGEALEQRMVALEARVDERLTAQDKVLASISERIP